MNLIKKKSFYKIVVIRKFSIICFRKLKKNSHEYLKKID